MAAVASEQGNRGAAFRTHTVFNQPPPLEGVDVFSTNTPLVEAVEREGAAWVAPRAAELGVYVGGVPQQEWGRLANENKPVLHTYDRYGNRIDEVEYHPAWHSLMAMGVENELHSLPWTSSDPAAHTARGALYMTAMQAEAGYACPITMTFAVVPAIRAPARVAAVWEPLVTATSYDPRLINAAEKGSAIAGMAMTEKQGGSDVRANTTVARADRRRRTRRGVRDHGAQVVLLSADVRRVPGPRAGRGGALLFPAAADPARRVTKRDAHPAPEGQARQPVQRLLGDRVHRRMGADGRRARKGVRTIIEMVGHTRLDCVFGAAAGMRVAVVNATHHTAHRSAFGKTLIDQPLMQNVLADLCLESEATTVLAMRLARAYDEAHADAEAGEQTATHSSSSGSPQRSASTGRASASRTTRSRRWSASAASATSRSQGCRACTARPRLLDLGGIGQRHEPRRAPGAVAHAPLARGLLGRGRAGIRRRPAAG